MVVHTAAWLRSASRVSPCNRLAPVARTLSLKERVRSPQIRDHAAELELKDLGVPHGHQRLHLPPSGRGKVDEIAYYGFRHAKRNCGMKEGEELWQRRIERSRQEWGAPFEVR